LLAEAGTDRTFFLPFLPLYRALVWRAPQDCAGLVDPYRVSAGWRGPLPSTPMRALFVDRRLAGRSNRGTKIVAQRY